jgi:hypothetical protein
VIKAADSFDLLCQGQRSIIEIDRRFPKSVVLEEVEVEIRRCCILFGATNQIIPNPVFSRKAVNQNDSMGTRTVFPQVCFVQTDLIKKLHALLAA